MTILKKCTELHKKHLTSRLNEGIIGENSQYGGETMAVSTIDRVREAEQKANEKQSAAELEAEQIIADAKNRAQQIIEDAKKKADELDRKAAAEAQSRADEIIRDRKAKAEAEAQALSDKTLKQKQNVINKLIQETLS